MTAANHTGPRASPRKVTDNSSSLGKCRVILDTLRLATIKVKFKLNFHYA